MVHAAGGDLASAGDSTHSTTLVVQVFSAAEVLDNRYRAEVHFIEPKEAKKLVRNILGDAATYFRQLDKKATPDWKADDDSILQILKSNFDAGVEVLTDLFRSKDCFASIDAARETIEHVRYDEGKKQLYDTLEPVAAQMVKEFHCASDGSYHVKLEADTAKELKLKLKPYTERSKSDSVLWPIVEYVRYAFHIHSHCVSINFSCWSESS